jgi:hypothetical protein
MMFPIFSSVDLLDELRSKRLQKAYKTEYLKIMSFIPYFVLTFSKASDKIQLITVGVTTLKLLFSTVAFSSTARQKPLSVRNCNG